MPPRKTKAKEPLQQPAAEIAAELQEAVEESLPETMVGGAEITGQQLRRGNAHLTWVGPVLGEFPDKPVLDQSDDEGD